MDYTFGDITVRVRATEKNYFFYRAQGASLQVFTTQSAKNIWGNITQQEVPVNVDQIDLGVELRGGVGPDTTAENHCSNCSGFDAMEQPYWGINVGRVHSDASWNGFVRVSGAVHSFSGEEVFG